MLKDYLPLKKFSKVLATMMMKIKKKTMMTKAIIMIVVKYHSG